MSRRQTLWPGTPEGAMGAYTGEARRGFIVNIRLLAPCLSGFRVGDLPAERPIFSHPRMGNYLTERMLSSGF